MKGVCNIGRELKGEREKNENDVKLAKYVLFIKACILLEEKVNLMLSITPYRQEQSRDRVIRSRYKSK